MARLARVVVPSLPHHVTQRFNRRQPVFLRDGDYLAYRELLAHWCAARGVEIWAYCLMPNHVHLIAVPATEDALRLALGEAHRRYTRRVISARAGAGICGRGASPRSRWTTGTCTWPRGT